MSYSVIFNTCVHVCIPLAYSCVEQGLITQEQADNLIVDPADYVIEAPIVEFPDEPENEDEDDDDGEDTGDGEEDTGDDEEESDE